jgi:hypothetical protein
MDIKNRVVQQCRFHYDPSIGGKPKQAFNLKDMGEGAVMELTPIGIYMKVWVGGPGAKVMQEHLVPYANTQSIMLAPEVEKEEKKK